jgi:3-hydroxymyristoyl/3-hydroxydecanoyl-(acyl carrier protein) dehydratase
VTAATAATVPLAIPEDHPAYAGHFPGAPVLPGVVLLDAALAAAHAHGLLPAGAFRIASAKFFRLVTPGTPLVLTQRLAKAGGVEFEIASGNERVASGRFVPAVR